MLIDTHAPLLSRPERGCWFPRPLHWRSCCRTSAKFRPNDASLYRRQAAMGSPEIPFLQIGGGRFHASFVVHVLEGEPDLVSTRCFQRACGKALQRGALAL